MSESPEMKINLDTLNTRDDQGLTPLFHAVIRGDTEQVKSLLEKGADPNLSVPGTNLTPLHQALWDSKEEIAKLLIIHGAKWDVQSRAGRTALETAFANNLFKNINSPQPTLFQDFLNDIELIKRCVLLAHRWSLPGVGRYKNFSFDFGLLPTQEIHQSFLQSFTEFTKTNQSQIISQIKSYHAFSDNEINQLIQDILTSLQEALPTEEKVVLEKIRSGGVVPILFSSKHFSRDTKQFEGHLEGAVFHDGHYLVRANRGAGSQNRVGLDITHFDSTDKLHFITGPLVKSVTGMPVDESFVNIAIPKLLNLQRLHLIKMKDQRQRNCKWLTTKALGYATLIGHIFHFFKQEGINEENAYQAAFEISRAWYKGFTPQDKIKLLLATTAPFSNTPFAKLPEGLQEVLFRIYVRAITKEKYKEIPILLEQFGLKSVFKATEDLVSALQLKDEKAVIEALERGAYIEGVPSERYVGTPLNHAISIQHLKLVELLLQRGANPNKPSGIAHMPLDEALEKENLEMCELLIKYGANPTRNQLKKMDELHLPKVERTITASEKADFKESQEDRENKEGNKNRGGG